jgi:hypothetical protein
VAKSTQSLPALLKHIARLEKDNAEQAARIAALFDISIKKEHILDATGSPVVEFDSSVSVGA